MPKTSRKPRKTRNKAAASSAAPDPKTAREAIDRLEFHRNAIALLPLPDDPKPGVAIILIDKNDTLPFEVCNCKGSGTRTCPHLKTLTAAYKSYLEKTGGKNPDADFRSSIWYKLAVSLAEGCRETPKTIDMISVGQGSNRFIRAVDSQQNPMIEYLSRQPDALRFMERCGPRAKKGLPSRRKLIERLGLLTLSENERIMAERGFKTRGQALEESFWFKSAYHGYRELGASGFTLEPAIDEQTGAFTVSVTDSQNQPVFRLLVPKQKVRTVLPCLKTVIADHPLVAPHPFPMKFVFRVSLTPEKNLDVSPLVQFTEENGNIRYFKREELEPLQYGQMVYVASIGRFVELDMSSQKAQSVLRPVHTVISRNRIPAFLDQCGEALQRPPFLVEPEVRDLQIFKGVEHVEVDTRALERDWCWLSVRYGFGSHSISLEDILQAKRAGKRFIETPEGWVDCEAPELDGIDSILDLSRKLTTDKNSKGDIKVSRLDLFRIRAASPKKIKITGRAEFRERLQQMLDLKPVEALTRTDGMTSSLRPYQELGTQWIRYLFENEFGGILCDDMGLGKTHQVMAFVLHLLKVVDPDGKILIVSPTTVLSHWQAKLKEHCPTLTAAVYHGVKRDLDCALGENQILLTSYGILRRDVDRLSEQRFLLAVFDEIQHIKNPGTIAYAAAKGLNARMKLGLTGTPIENTLHELKALMDLAVPGYLGSDKGFSERYVTPLKRNLSSPRRQELRRLIYPFTLRRLKSTVLDELPEKIEDIRTCGLSDDQVRLYREAIESKGEALLASLNSETGKVSYIHIFALLTLLKQICDHPALLNNGAADYNRYQSGKWNLFKELLEESLDSGQKVVVYSQFLGMLDIIEDHLKTLNVGYAKLTGATRKRGEVISRFNTDPDCRVFAGSLKAGGTGIDLVAASVVIHYDRWWNAAKEDQATDRVHRIGQKRGVQVFKLVTEGTLEEKISALIQEKRNLMDTVVKEDDPGLLKTFSRDDLIEMLSLPIEGESASCQMEE